MTDETAPVAEEPSYTPGPVARALMCDLGDTIHTEAERTAGAMNVIGVPAEWAVTATVIVALSYAAGAARFVAAGMLGREPNRANWDRACDEAWKMAVDAVAEEKV